MPLTAKPLSGLKVIELGTLIAGPFASRICGEFGAEVIKIESPDGGDPLRKWRKLYEGTSLWWFVQARNKKSLTLNLKHPDGLAILKKLLAEADILIENFRPGVLEKLGLGWDVLHALNPKLVMVRLSGFGQTGPMKDQPGFGAVGESMGGLRYITGFEDRPPVRTGISIGDSIAALWGVIGALMALRHREVNGGQGQVVDVALYEAIFAMMESMVPEFDVFGFIRERTGNIMPGITPSSIHTSADGKHVQIGANGDAIFKRFMLVIGREDLANDPALASNDGRDSRRDEIYGVIDRWVNSQPLDTVLTQLNQADVPVSRIFSAEDMFSDPQYLAREMFMQAKLPDGKDFKMPGIVPKLSETPGDCAWVGPQLGEHNAQVLNDLGYDPQQIAKLREDGAI
ncbi:MULTISPECIES: CaiB/BaiF CoA-transferase family protein [unclassified Pseudomonas]|jgi:formyl-CoA transferase|uniref:CaiB/BaiF CoA transferase family protein n=1 Tax=Pseudomonas TaxID=286 RepID=UPI00098AFE42|nr:MULTISPECIES: CaiB/BaiF CoA-transferase family protein [unclassified Pseudomonas]MBU0523352.1 CoA transferase [Gammaproteobacteria bacterium]MBU0819782.1 CoA transferase [Gammaproteobacteria bacterium]MBU0842150.1 CoA transferase [Gammaproteobacteria bacterium]MBU1842732.1 CoA transferase [Gammaproteobacteria bacterium]OOL37773.1 formyl-CoA transferase [Pseudomonas sp. FSL W5-0299]